MTRETFDLQLSALNERLLALGTMVTRVQEQAIRALADRNADLANELIAGDHAINQAQHDIEDQCLFLIASQQPVARDLRLIFSISSIAWELERMADHAKGIATLALRLVDQPMLKPLIDIPRMAEKTEDMLRRSLDAFVNRDAEAARQISLEDDAIDQLYDQVFRELLTFMAEDPKTITRATRLIWVAHNLERAADRVTNICERVVFVVTGKMEEIGASKY